MQRKKHRRLRKPIRKALEWIEIITLAFIGACFFIWMLGAAILQYSLNTYPLTEAEMAEIEAGR